MILLKYPQKISILKINKIGLKKIINTNKEEFPDYVKLWKDNIYKLDEYLLRELNYFYSFYGY